MPDVTRRDAVAATLTSIVATAGCIWPFDGSDDVDKATPTPTVAETPTPTPTPAPTPTPTPHDPATPTPTPDALVIGEDETHVIAGVETYSAIYQAEGSTLIQSAGTILITTHE